MKLKKLIAMVLCICMLASLMPSYAFAEETEETISDTTDPIPEIIVEGEPEPQTVVEPGPAVQTVTESAPESQTVTVTEQDPSACTHNYVETGTVEPTCKEQGYTIYTCSLCGSSYKDNYTATVGHTLEDAAAIEPTCTEKGRTAGKVCSICKEVIEGCTEIPALGHTSVEVPEVPAEVGKAGVNAGHVCSRCGEKLDGFEEIPALKETVITIEKQPEDAEPKDGEVIFSVVASVNTEDALAYQWQKLELNVEYKDDAEREAAWKNIDSETKSQLLFKGFDDEKALAEAMNYAFRCVITAGEAVEKTREVHILKPESGKKGPAKGGDLVDSGDCGTNVTWSLDSEGTLTITGSGDMSSYSYASAVPWNQYKNSILTVNISSGVTGIGDYNFAGCGNLAGITIPLSVTKIGKYAFNYCSSLTDIDIPSGVTVISQAAFWGCSSLTVFTIPDGVTSIGGGAFMDCTALTGVNIPYSVTSIGNSAFLGCTGLTTITIPDSVTSLGVSVFSGCTGLTGVTISSRLTSINEEDFEYCPGLTSVIIPPSVTSISSFAFADCSGLTSISIPLSVKSIGRAAFNGCTSLTNIYYEGTAAQWGAVSIDDLNDPLAGIVQYNSHAWGAPTYIWADNNGSVTATHVCTYNADHVESETAETEYEVISYPSFDTLGVGVYTAAFNNPAFDTQTKEVEFSGVGQIKASGECGAAGNNLIWTLDYAGTLTISGSGEMADYSSYDSPWFSDRGFIHSISIGFGTTTVGQNAFYECSNLASVTIPASVTGIGQGAFYGCNALSYVSYGGTQWQWETVTIGDGNDCLEAAATEVAQEASGSCGTGLTWVLDSEGILTISGTGNMDDYSADTSPWKLGCNTVKAVVLQQGVKSVGSYAFSSCSNMTSVTFTSSVTGIGAGAFSYCSSLTGVSLPSGLTEIGAGAFSYCSGLTSVTIPSKVTGISSETFAGCTGLTSVTIPVSVTGIGDRAFYGCSSLTDVIYDGTRSKWTAISIGEGNDPLINAKITVVPIASGTCGAQGDNLTWALDDDGTLTISGSGAMYDYTSEGVVPWWYNRKKVAAVIIEQGVTRIGHYAFHGCNLTGISIPDSVTSIGGYAFAYCSALTSVILPASVTGLGIGVFSNCSSLKTAGPIGSGCDFQFGWTDSIPKQAFESSGSLKIITIPEGVTSIGEWAFYGCSGLTGIIIPDSVISIGDCVFCDCTSLTSIAIPEGVTRISRSAFHGCCALTDVEIPASVTSIDDYAFSGCRGLSGISIPDNVTSIGARAFYDCEALTDVALPNGLVSIGYEAFNGCSGITGITIPDSVTSIGYRAFKNCSSLSSATIPATVTSIGNGVFSNCSNLKTAGPIDSGCDFQFGWEDMIPAYAFSSCASLTGITLPDTITAIGVSAFEECTGLTGITIPESVTSIGNSAFSSCSGLTGIVIPEGVNSISEYVFYCCSNLTHITLPSGITSIGKYAFFNCSGLTSISIPDSVSSIGNCAFKGCISLADITIPSGMLGIGDYVFQDCSGLTSVIIPDGVTSIGNYTFSDCVRLSDVEIPSSLSSIGNSAFYGCSGLTSITLPSSVSGIGNSAFYNCRGLKNLTIPGGVTGINNSAFCGCSGLTDVTILEGVSSIGSAAFSGCSKLKRVTIPLSVTSIGDSAFKNCSSLTDVYYGGTKASWLYIEISDNNAAVTSANIHYSNPVNVVIDSGECGAQGNNLIWIITDAGKLTISGNGAMANYSASTIPWSKCSSVITSVTIEQGVTNIGQCAFQSCSALTSVILSNSIKTIGSSAFSGCSGLTTITIPSGVTSIGNQAFCNCSGLTTITIPSGVTSISNQAFYGCSGLTAITIPSGATSIGNQAFYNCSRLSDITIPDRLTSIGSAAFSGCGNLTTITIPSSVTSIGSNAFSGCIGLKTAGPVGGNYNYEYGWTESLPAYAFSGCSSLTDIDIQSSIANIGNYAFNNCTSLISITIPDGVTGIGNYAFSGCSGLESIVIPSSVTSIGNYAFSGCSRLVAVFFEGSRPAIGTNCFGNVTATVRYIGADPSWTNASLTGYGGELIWKSFYILSYNANGGENPPDWQWKRDNEEITLSDVIPVREHFQFSGWSLDPEATTADYLPGDSLLLDESKVLFAVWRGIFTVSYDANGGENAPEPQEFFAGESIAITSDIPIKDGVRFAGWATSKFAFSIDFMPGDIYEGQEDLLLYAIWTEVEMTGNCGAQGDNVIWELCANGTVYISGHGEMGDTISLRAFINKAYDLYHHRILKVVIEEGVTSICDFAFNGCDTLNSILIPSTITKIGAYAFKDCPKVGEIIIPEGVTAIERSTFEGCTLLFSVSIPNTLTRIEEKAFYKSGVRISELPEGLRIIGDEAFYECFGVGLNTEIITIPDSVEYIGAKAFYFCKNLKAISISYGVQTIEEYTFCNCESLWYVGIPSSVKEIKKNAFMACVSLKEISIPEGVKEIGAGAFSACGLEYIRLPESLETVDITSFGLGVKSAGPVGSNCCCEYAWKEKIPENVFGTWGNLETVIIPSSIKTIGKYAFYLCAPLKDVYYENTMEDWNRIQIDEKNDSLLNANLYCHVHDWEEPSYLWAEDNRTVTAKRVCKVFESHIETETVSTRLELITEPTYTAPGLAIYTAIFSNEAFETQTKQAEISIEDLDPIVAYVKRCYEVILGREGDQGGIDNWVRGLKSGSKKGADIVRGFLKSAEYTNKGNSNEETVRIVYRAMLNREADAGGLASWQKYLDAGMSTDYVVRGFAGSAEFRNLCANYGIQPGSITLTEDRDRSYNVTAYVSRCYEQILGRKGDVGGLNTWTRQLNNKTKQGASIVNSFITSAEFKGRNLSNDAAVEILYQSMMGRASDPGGKANWMAALDDGMSLSYVAAGFAGSAEFKEICRNYGITAGSITLTEYRDRNRKVTQFVSRNYQYALERKGDIGGLNTWTEKIIRKQMTPKQVAKAFVFSAECRNRGLDDREFLTMLYWLYMGREPDAGGMNTWLGKLASGMSRETVADRFADSAEFRKIVAGYGL